MIDEFNTIEEREDEEYMTGDPSTVANFLFAIRESRDLLLEFFDENSVKIYVKNDDIYFKIYDLISFHIEMVPMLVDALKKEEDRRVMKIGENDKPWWLTFPPNIDGQ